MKLLKQRNQIKAKKPTFTRQENHRYDKINDKWRRPRGIHSKMRLHIRGKKRSPETGWGSPRSVEGMHPSGVMPILVHNVSDLSKVKKGEGIIISSGCGQKKRAEIVLAAEKQSIPLLNVKDAKAFIKGVEADLESRKKSSKSKPAAEKAPKKTESHEKKAEHKADHKEAKEDSKESKHDHKAHDAKHESKGDHKEAHHEDHKKKAKEEKDKALIKPQ